MKKIIKKILKEDRQEQFLNKIIKVIKNDFPLFKNLKDYGFKLSEEELNYVLSGIFGEPVRNSSQRIYNQNGNQIYKEDPYGSWYKSEYDENGKIIYKEDSDGFWEKYEYDDNGNRIYLEGSDGYWVKIGYDENGNKIYVENSDGGWIKYGYNKNGYQIYREDSDGYIDDNR